MEFKNTESALDPQVRRYLREVVGKLKLPPEGLARIVNTTLTLNDVWLERRLVAISPDIASSPPEDEEELGVPLDGVMHKIGKASPRTSLISIIGPSGYGKSTAFQMLGVEAARSMLETGVGQLPLFLSPKDLLAVNLESINPMDEILGANLFINDSNDKLKHALREIFKNDECKSLVLIDAIDDATDRINLESTWDAIEKFSHFVSRLESQNPGCTILVSCRDDAWFGDNYAPLRQRSTCFQLQSLSLTDIARYIDVSIEHSRDLQEDDAEHIKSRIIAEPKLSHLLRRPLMLGLSMYVVEKTNYLPPGLGGICEELTILCLGESSDSRSLSNETIILILELAAWKLTERSIRSNHTGTLSAAELGECVRLVKKGTDRSSVLKASTAETLFLNLAHESLGLFGELSPDEFGFTDEVFCLYFSGKYLIKQPRNTLFKVIDENPTCPQLIVLGQCQAHKNDLDGVIVLIEDLFEENNTRYLLNAGELLSSIFDIAKTERERWLRRWCPTIAKHLHDCRSCSDVAFADRVRAGNALATIGDPILDNLPINQPLIEVKGGGEVAIGSLTSPEIIGDKPKYERIHWFPKYTTKLDDYKIGIHPVTNFEYAQFMEEGGYSNNAYWKTPEALRWKNQKEGILEELTPIVQKSIGLHYRKDIEGGFMSVIKFESMREEFIRKLVLRKEPLYFFDSRFNRPNQPVVGINLWEAKAYCVWLTERMLEAGTIDIKQICRLPTEEEWEYAAAPLGALHPWGKEWNEEYCHMRRDEWIASAVSIGTFSHVQSHLGCQDMIGNVFDTTLSAADEYKDRPKPHSKTGLNEIITRGGSWLATATAARSVRFRSWDPPCNAYADQSFRIVVSPLDLA